jgi:TP901 family phage tail tape measure protein
MAGYYEFVIGLRDNFSAGFGRLGQGMTNTINNAGTFAFKFNEINNSLGQFGQQFSTIIQPGIEYEKQMKEVEAITGVSGKKLEELGMNAKRLGENFGFSASSGLESYKIILSKLDPELAKSSTAMEAMGRNAAMLSTAMKGDMVGATTALTTAMNAYGISTKDPIKASAEMSRMTDMITKSTLVGSAEVPQLTAALGSLGATAAMAGIGFAEQLAVLQVLDQKGFKQGAEGGIAFRNAILKMGQGRFIPKETQESLIKAGVNIGTLGNTTLSYVERLGELKKIQHDTALVGHFFGTENVVAGQALLNNMGLIQDFTAKTLDSDGATKKFAGTMGSSFEATMRRVGSTMANYGIAIFESTKAYLPLIQTTGTLLFGFSQMLPTLAMMGSGLMWATAKTWGLLFGTTANTAATTANMIATMESIGATTANTTATTANVVATRTATVGVTASATAIGRHTVATTADMVGMRTATVGVVASGTALGTHTAITTTATTATNTNTMATNLATKGIIGYGVSLIYTAAQGVGTFIMSLFRASTWQAVFTARTYSSIGAMVANRTMMLATAVGSSLYAAGLWVMNTAQWAVSASAWAMLSPFLAIGIGIAAIGLAVYAIYKNWDTLKGYIYGFGQFLWKTGEFFLTYGNPLWWLYKGVSSIVTYFFPQVGNQAMGFFSWIGGVLWQVGYQFMTTLNPMYWLGIGISKVFMYMFPSIGKDFTWFFNGIGKFLQDWGKWLHETVKWIWDGVAGFFSKMGIALGMVSEGIDKTASKIKKPIVGKVVVEGPDTDKYNKEIKDREKELGLPPTTDVYAGGKGATDASNQVGGGANKGLEGVSGGGSKPTNIHITIGKLNETIQITTQNLKEGASDVEAILMQMLMRVVNGANQTGQ